MATVTDTAGAGSDGPEPLGAADPGAGDPGAAATAVAAGVAGLPDGEGVDGEQAVMSRTEANSDTIKRLRGRRIGRCYPLPAF